MLRHLKREKGTKKIKMERMMNLKLWEIIKGINEGTVQKGDVFEGIKSGINLSIEYDGSDLNYKNVMGLDASEDIVTLCSGEMNMEFVKSDANMTMTYSQVFSKFVNRNKALVEYINDYRPAGTYKLQIWMINHKTIFVYYDVKRDTFEIVSDI
jgi:hypothetical protein